ncbi:MAG: putative metal-binding motif-containing protein [Myxococcales bacterium]|nr:putative metal-binding motif-containing protein [Myxococcales bacterium]
MRSLWRLAVWSVVGCVGTVPAAPSTVVDADGDGFAADVDCDDGDPAVRGPSVWLKDDDGDGVGVTSSAVSGCEPGPGWVSFSLIDDCDDTDPAVGAEQLYYADVDGDGFSGREAAALSCVALEGFSLIADDCNDLVATTFPGAPELCDGVDNDCASGIDDGGACGAWIPLGFEARDVDFDRVNERLLAVSSDTSGSSAYLIDVLDGSTTEISLPVPVDYVSVAPNGRTAVAASQHDSRVLWMDLDARKAYPAWRFSEYDRIEDVVASAGEMAILLDNDDIVVVNVVKGTVEQQGFFQDAHTVVIDPTGTVMYANDASRMHRFDVSVLGIDWVATGDIGWSQDMWMSNGGGQLYSRSGYVMQASSDPLLDMTYRTTLPLPKGIYMGFAGSEAHDRLFAAERGALFAFSFTWPTLLGEIPFPPRTPSGDDYVDLDRVFVADATDRLVVLGHSHSESLLWSPELSSVP